MSFACEIVSRSKFALLVSFRCSITPFAIVRSNLLSLELSLINLIASRSVMCAIFGLFGATNHAPFDFYYLNLVPALVTVPFVLNAS